MTENKSNASTNPWVAINRLGNADEETSAISAQTAASASRIMTVRYSPDGQLSTTSAPSAIIPWSNDYNVALAASKKALRRHLPSTSAVDDYWLAVFVNNGQETLAEISADAFIDTLQELGNNLFLCGGAPTTISKPLDISLLPVDNTTDTENYYTFDLMSIGDSGVGKTNYLRYFTRGKPPPPSVTVAYDNWEVQRFRVKETNEAIKTSLWDTAGLEKHKALAPQTLRRISGIFLMYDITDEASFDNCKKWLNEARQHIQPGAQIVLVGNQLDRQAIRKVRSSTAQSFASEHGWPFIETSSITGANVDAAFQLLVQEMFTQFKRENTLQKHFKPSRDSAQPRINLADKSQNHWSWFKVLSWAAVDTVAIGLLYMVLF
ncbi:P-loop containing nucleoside triphosphate hydrolase protein [Ceratobasidium sp. AG-I]|nr:P-loop containing nucleoside triphosphate hydrolase protein [Ceratobasidium sp. AG-I]